MLFISNLEQKRWKKDHSDGHILFSNQSRKSDCSFQIVFDMRQSCNKTRTCQSFPSNCLASGCNEQQMLNVRSACDPIILILLWLCTACALSLIGGRGASLYSHAVATSYTLPMLSYVDFPSTNHSSTPSLYSFVRWLAFAELIRHLCSRRLGELISQGTSTTKRSV